MGPKLVDATIELHRLVMNFFLPTSGGCLLGRDNHRRGADGAASWSRQAGRQAGGRL